VSQLIAALQQELAQLERKATRIRELLADYVGEAKPQALATQPKAMSAQTSPIRFQSGIPVPRSKKALIKDEIEQLLLSGPTHRKKILEVLESKGLMGHEKDPMASLAAYLSAFSDNFINDGSGTWSIREQTHAA
jgi:hypothetical protein